jgi:hypothetical protein
LKFINATAIQLSRRDPDGRLDAAIDFMLRVFVEGRVRGKGTPLTVEERIAYFQRIDSEAFTCTFTGRRLQFFRSFMGIWLPPIELFGEKKETNGNPSMENNPDEEYSPPIEIIETWVVVLEQRKYFKALLNHYQSRNDPTFFKDIQGEHYEDPEGDPEIETDVGIDFE